MLDDQQLEKAVHDLIMDLCEVLYLRGYDSVNVGAMMRLVGVGDDQAARHDKDFFALDQEFQTMLDSRKERSNSSKTPKRKKAAGSGVPTGVTIH